MLIKENSLSFYSSCGKINVLPIPDDSSLFVGKNSLSNSNLGINHNYSKNREWRLMRQKMYGDISPWNKNCKRLLMTVLFNGTGCFIALICIFCNIMQ